MTTLITFLILQFGLLTNPTDVKSVDNSASLEQGAIRCGGVGTINE